MAVVGTAVVVAPPPAFAERLFVSVFIDTPGPRGSIAVVGDSLMLGSAYGPPFEDGWGPTLAHMLSDRGWGPVRMAAGVGFQAGKMVAGNPGANMSKWLTDQRAQGFDPQVIVASMGPNDIIACNGSVTCAADDIRGFMDVAGPDHEVWWALQTTQIPANQEAWNQALQTVAAERPEPHIVGLADDPSGCRHPPGRRQHPSPRGAAVSPTQHTDRRRRDRPIGRIATHQRRGRTSTRRAVVAVPTTPSTTRRRYPQLGTSDRCRRHADGRPLDVHARRIGRRRRQRHCREPVGRRVPHRVAVRRRTAQCIERQLPRRREPRRASQHAVEPTGANPVRLQQRGDRHRRRPPGRVRAQRRAAVLSDDTQPCTRHAQDGQSVDDPHHRARWRSGSRRDPHRHRRKCGRIPHRVSVCCNASGRVERELASR